MQISKQIKAKQSQLTQEIPTSTQKLAKKVSILKKKKLPSTKLYSNVDIKHVVNIHDLCFVNQKSLRFPESSEETVFKTLYHYKMISKVTLNNDFLNIQLKKNQENYLAPEYFFERLRSFGDKQMANIANHLQRIHNQFIEIKASSPSTQNEFNQRKQETLLQNFLHSMQGRKFFLYFSQITPQKINLKNIVFSIPLLKAIGINIKNIAMDFLKYRHVQIEVFSAKHYAHFFEQCFDNFAELQTKLLQNPEITLQERLNVSSFQYMDEIIRKRQGIEGIYEQLSRAKVRWTSPHPSICCLEIIDIDQVDLINLPRKKRIINFEESKPQQQIQSLRQIGISNPLLLIQQKEEHSQSKTQKV